MQHLKLTTLEKWETWPPEVELPPIPAIKVWEVDFLGDCARGTKRLDADRQHPARLSPEFYLGDLLTMDIESNAAIQAVIDRWGFLFGRYDELDRYNAAFPLCDVMGPLGGWAGRYLDPGNSKLGYELRLRRQSLQLEMGLEQKPFELYQETRIGLVWLRDLSRLAQTYIETGSLDWLPYQWESEDFGIPRPPDGEYAEAIFTTGINAALRWVHPYIHVPSLAPDPAFTAAAHMGFPPLYSAIAAQLYNHIATGASFTRCHNEFCPRPRKLFNRHIDEEGRTNPSPRSTAKFCSVTCKNAQKQRERRRNKKGAS